MNNHIIMVSRIMDKLMSLTEMNFQKMFISMIEIICDSKLITLEKVQPSNGDAKNDGWIPTKNVYFGVYSPSDANISSLNSIVKKLEGDLDGLCDHVFVQHHWGKTINEFYLIVNTHDKDLPADPSRKIDSTIETIKAKYNKKFTVRVLAVNDIKKYLISLDDDVIRNINNQLDIYSIDNDFSVADVCDFVDEYTSLLVTNDIPNTSPDYSRITVDKKISLNNLQEKREEIMNNLLSSHKIDNYLEFVNNEGIGIEKYEKIKNYIISVYNELSKKYSDKDLYNELINRLVYESMLSNKVAVLKAIVINIFIKCDIFRKE